MKDIIVFEFEKDEQIFAEVENADYLQDELVSNCGNVIKRTTQKFGIVLSSIKTVAKSTYDNIKLTPNRPDEVSIEFGLKLSGDVSAIIASTSAEGHIKVTLKWSDINKKKVDQIKEKDKVQDNIQNKRD